MLAQATIGTDPRHSVLQRVARIHINLQDFVEILCARTAYLHGDFAVTCFGIPMIVGVS